MKFKNPFSKKLPSHLKVILRASAIVMFWYGVWGLTETFIFPTDPLLSYLTAIVIGLIILLADDFHIMELHAGGK